MLPFQSLGIAVYNAATDALVEYVDLVGGSYGTTAYAPTVATRAPEIAGQSPYLSVIDPVTLTISGDTPGNVLAAFAKLTRLLDWARQFIDGDTPTYRICIRAQVDGSATVWEALILGAIPGEQPLTASPVWNPAALKFTIPDVVISFERAGLWESLTSDTAASSSATDNGTVFTVTLPSDVPQLSPYKYDGTMPASQAIYYSTSWLITGGASSDFEYYEAENYDATDGVLRVPAANEIASGNVIRITPALANTQYNTAWVVSGSVLKTPGVVAAWAIVDVNGGNWQFETEFYNASSGGSITIPASMPVVDVPFDNQRYRIIPLGVITVPEGGFRTFYLRVSCDAVHVNNWMDLDRILFARITEETSITQFPAFDTGGFMSTDVPHLTIDPKLRSRREPLVALISATNPSTRTFARPYLGDSVPMVSGSALAGVFLEVGQGSFRRPNPGFNVPFQQVHTVTRYPATLIPT